jgi:cysteine desulfurase
MKEIENRGIYLDYNASTPVDPAVADVMREFLERPFGKPSSTHWAGLPARKVVEEARRQVAGLLGCAADEVIFTSGGSEANNLAIKGVIDERGQQDVHIITSAIEHPAIVEPCRFLERHGARVSWLGVDEYGQVNPDDLRKALRPETALVTIMHANSEVGTLQPIAECARIARGHGVLLHTDAAQSVGKIPVSVAELGVDLLSIAGHKLYAPKGIGALYVRSGVGLEPLVHGAGHENGRRAGTESAMLTAALGRACEQASVVPETDRVATLRDQFWSRLSGALGDRVVRNGHPRECLPNTLHVSFPGHTGGEILAANPQIAASTGSACHAGSVETSAVLTAMGMTRENAVGAVRFSLGRFSTEAEIAAAAELVVRHLETSCTRRRV